MRVLKKVSLSVLFLLSLIGAQSVTSPVSYAQLIPFTQTDVEYIDQKQSFRDTREIYVSCAGTIKTTLVGVGNDEKAFRYFLDQGLTPEQAAGIVGNLMQESGTGIDPKIVNEIGATGIAQWLGDRKTAMGAWVQANNDGDGDDLSEQLNFLWSEVTEGGSQVQAFDPLGAIKSTTTVSEAVLSWEETFERSGGSALEQRIQYAESVLVLYGSNYAGSSSNPVQACTVTGADGEAGEIVSGYSLPLPRSIFAEDPGRLSKPHHNSNAAIDVGVRVGGGDPVFSVTDGTVTQGPVGGNCGDGVAVQMDNGITLLYCHGFDGGSFPGANVGDRVNAGQQIMTAGYTGRVIPAGPNGAHLHFQITVSGKLVCPQKLLEDIFYGRPADITQLSSTGCTRG